MVPRKVPIPGGHVISVFDFIFNHLFPEPEIEPEQ